MGLMTEAEEHLFRSVLDAVGRLPNQMRQKLAQSQWESIALTVDESNFSGALAIGGTLGLQPQFSQQVLITSIVAVVPPGATGTIILGGVTIPVLAGTTVIAPVQKQLGPNDVRSLTIAVAAGAAMLWITGQQLPTSGVLAP